MFKRMLGLVLTAVTLALTGRAAAQTSSALVLLPWQEDTHAETYTSLTGYSGDTDAPAPTSTDIDLLNFRAVGRARSSPQNTQWGFGWDVNYLDIDTNDPALPERLVDQAVAGGVKLGELDGWSLGAVFGVGYAGNAPYNDGDAWYGLGSLMASRELENGAKLTLLLDYDGNRPFLPDIPLPGIAYADKLNDELSYTLGFPVSSITWTPTDQWRVHAAGIIPLFGTVRVDYHLSKKWSLYGEYLRSQNGYWVQGDDKNRRLFLQQQQLEAGVRFRPAERTELILGVGYAFDQSFERGFDTRDTDTVRDITDEPYVRFALKWAF